MKLRHLILCGAIATLAACGSTPEQRSVAPSASAGSASAGAGGASSARGPVPVQQNQTRQQAFERLDTNNNGAISRSEAQASPPLMVIFLDMDTNSDDQLSAEEWADVPLVSPDGTLIP